MMLSLTFKTKSRMDSGIYIRADYSRERATLDQFKSSSMQVPTHRMSETMTESCRRWNLLSVSRKCSISSKSLRQSPANKCRRLCRWVSAPSNVTFLLCKKWVFWNAKAKTMTGSGLFINSISSKILTRSITDIHDFFNMNRGSEWRIWDLHFHTPASYDYKNKSVTCPKVFMYCLE